MHVVDDYVLCTILFLLTALFNILEQFKYRASTYLANLGLFEILNVAPVEE